VHGPCLGVFVLGVEGDEQGQAGADGLGDVPHRPNGAESLAEQLRCRKILGLQQGLQICLGLSGREICGGLPGSMKKDLGIAGEDLSGEGVPMGFPQPGACPEEVFQDFRQAAAVAALLQGEKFTEPGRGLRGAQSPDLCGGGELGENCAVIIPRQAPGFTGVCLCGVPCLR